MKWIQDGRRSGMARWAVVGATCLMIAGFILLMWYRGSQPASVAPDPQSVTPARARGHAQAALVGSTAPGPRASASARMNPREWGESFHRAKDRFAFVSSAAAAAYAGDARAQYWIWEALRGCWPLLKSYELSGKGDARAGLQLQLERLSSAPPELQLQERETAKFRQCEGFLDSDPFASLPHREKGYPESYWLERSIAEGDVLAGLEAARQANTAIEKMTAQRTAPPAEYRDDIRQYETQALASRDPEALMQLGFMVMSAGGPDAETAEAAMALILLACDKGYDCSTSNPVWGACMAGQQNCTAQGSFIDGLRNSAGPEYGRIFAKRQDIEDLVWRGDARGAFDKYLKPAVPRP